MKRNLILGVSIFLVGLFITTTSCTKEYIDAEQAVCFENEVLPIFQSNCTQSGCHNSTDKEKGYDLSSYATIVKKGIKAGDYKNSEIYKVLVLPFGEEAMPQDPYPRLSTDQITTIALWIEQGAKNTTGCTSACDTTVSKYSTQIAPMMTTYCNGCHSGSAPSGAIDLTTYSGVKLTVDAGSFVGSIKHETGWSAMPKNANKLSDCNISLVDKWVREGALNN